MISIAPKRYQPTMRKLIIISTIIFMGIGSVAKAQQFPSYTQHFMNKFVVNPAFAGSEGYTTVSFIAREQTLGFKNTPKVHSLMIDSRILGNSYILKKFNVRKKKPEKTRSGKTGWGAYFFSDLNGPIDKTGVNGTYSYHIDMGESQLSFGLSLIFFQLRIQGEDLNPYDPSIPDPLLTGGKEKIWITDANFGVFYTTEHYYAGYSSNQLFNSIAQFGAEGQGQYKLRREHVILGGYRFYASNRIQIEPTLKFLLSETLLAKADLGVRGIYDGMYWGGFNYQFSRKLHNLAIIAGIKYDQYMFGYSFEMGFNDMTRQSLGTHEIVVSYRFGDTARRYKWLNTY